MPLQHPPPLPSSGGGGCCPSVGTGGCSRLTYSGSKDYYKLTVGANALSTAFSDNVEVATCLAHGTRVSRRLIDMTASQSIKVTQHFKVILCLPSIGRGYLRTCVSLPSAANMNGRKAKRRGSWRELVRQSPGPGATSHAAAHRPLGLLPVFPHAHTLIQRHTRRPAA